MPARLVLRASAKVNLVLEVLGKRGDGYHDVATVLHAIDLSDRLILEDAESVRVETTAPGVPTDGSNLVCRAAQLLRDETGVERGVRITLDKRIPVAAGLGGGSSDAAATLLGLNRLWRLRLSSARLRELGAALGADVPFFLGRGPGVASGRGDRVAALPAARSYALVLVNPNVALSATEVYGRLTPQGFSDGARTSAMVAALRRRSTAGVLANLYNGLESAVEPVYPVITQMKAALMAAGATAALMSGSGPTVFGVARSFDHARQLRSRVARASWSCWSVRTISGVAVRSEASGPRSGARWGVAKR